MKKVSKRPCKYGPRDEDGLCPKKPKAAKKPAAKKKAPCKYGERVNGKCPKKPATVKNYKSVDAAGRQAGEVLRSKTATPSQKKEAVKVLGTAVAVESGKKVAEQATRNVRAAAKKAAKNPKVKAAAISGAKKVAKVAGAATGAGVVLVAGGAALSANRRREAAAWARSQLAATKKRLAPQKLTAQQEATLYNQYYEFALRRPVTNSTLGK